MTTVELIAHTAVDTAALRHIGYEAHDPEVWHADELAEFAGRNCYRSFDRPNPSRRENSDYLAHILDVGHESVLEHSSATFYIETSRSVLTELERHRHLSFSVVSQRYVDPTKLGIHHPPAIDDLPTDDAIIAEASLRDVQAYTTEAYEHLVELYTKAGLPRKKAREAARAVLPNMTNSPMVVTGNHRAWRYVIKQRFHEAADAEIRTVAGLLLAELRRIAPNTYQDIPDTPYSY
ncbi:ThyX-like thymidylate synthase [Gordonia phage Aleemily]|uniref:ThyX-like thymidylate synthase n=1 Tax=Gordonia phage Aleemily TaxID=2965181 RepID=A0A9E7QCC8_9CAUD|nr:ThyX-like thymidylate synthase [Gordonia phage Aleemily]